MRSRKPCPVLSSRATFIPTRCWAVVIAALVVLVGAANADENLPRVEVMRLPKEAIAPQAATDGRSLHLIYFKGDPRHGNILYIRSDDGGRTFTMPIAVNSQPGSAIAIGTVRVPQIAVGRNGRVHVAWMGSDTAEPKVGGKASPMLYARMTDAGDAFEAQRNVITKQAGLDGGGSVAADGEGNVYVAWHAPKTEKGEADRWVWVARSQDDGKTFAPEVAANPEPTGACGCCGMKISAAPGGEVYVIYRSATERVNRDMYVLTSTDHARTFTVSRIDPWKVGVCVMSTSAVSGLGSQAVGAWETQGHVRFSLISKDVNASEPRSVPGPSNDQKHPAVAINTKGQFVIAWTEGTGWNKGGDVRWQVFGKDGVPITGQSGHAEGLPAWSMPAAFTAPDDTFRILY